MSDEKYITFLQSPKQYQQLMVKLTKSNRRKLSDNEEILTSSRGFDADLPDEVISIIITNFAFIYLKAKFGSYKKIV